MSPAAAPKGSAPSRRMPIAVAAGVATGVLVGLLMLHAGEPAKAASEGGPRAVNVAAEPGPTAAHQKAPPVIADARAKVTAAAADAHPAVAMAAPADAAPVATTSTEPETTAGEPGDGNEAEPALEKATLTFEVTPRSLSDLVIRVDGERIHGAESEVTLKDGRARVRVSARAAGYLTWRRKITVHGDDIVHIRLRQPSLHSSEGPGGSLDF